MEEPALPVEPTFTPPPAPEPTEPAAPAAEPAFTLPSADGYVLGYEADENQNIDGLLKACAETKMECVRGKDIDELVNKEVDLIISYSNKWHVFGVWPQIQNAKAAAIPIFMLNADSGEEGVYNLSTLYRSTKASLEWMMEEMGGEGEFVYFNFGSNGFTQEIIDEVLAAYPNVIATSMPASYEEESLTQESIIELMQANPEIKAIWSNENQMDIFWAIANQDELEQRPLFLCNPRLDNLSAWKDWLDADPDFKCFATIQPGGTDYEGVYAALFYLAGFEINPEALGGKYGNTFLYDYPIITSENLYEWMGKLDSLEEAEYGFYRLPAMTPEEIRNNWFK
jgi:ABC-type sugar transport system substrate-binding protein